MAPGEKFHAQAMASAGEAHGVERGHRRKALRRDVFQLFQRSKRGFHEAVLFLVAADE